MLRNRLRGLATGALTGLLAGAAGIAAAQLAAAIIRPEASPVLAVGGTVIDATPTPLKEFAVRQFGTNDKLVLLGSIAVGIAVFAALVGIVARRHRLVGLFGAGAFGVIGMLAAVTRPASRPTDIFPALIGGVTAVFALDLLTRRSAPVVGPSAAPVASSPAAPVAGPSIPSADSSAIRDRPVRMGGVERRRFLGAAALVAGGAVLAGVGGSLLARARTGSAEQARERVRLPVPADPGPPPETAPGYYTPAGDFYRVDTALTVPRIDPSTWALKIHGMVDRPTTITFEQLLARPLVQRDITLNCVSNEVGGPYVGNARWLGALLAPILMDAGVRAGADQLVARSIDGMTVGTPVATLMDGRDAMLVVGMNGAPLPLEHGFPVRVLTPGLYGYVGACKWVVDLELTTFDAYDAYWVKRKWARLGPVKTASRIDRPAAFAPVPAGDVRVQGVAWAQHRGISRVEVQVDDGPWAAATLLPVPSTDTWVQWTWTWAATKGSHQLRVRATDKTGATQTPERVGTFPSGATGWHTQSINVT